MSIKRAVWKDTESGLMKWLVAVGQRRFIAKLAVAGVAGMLVVTGSWVSAAAAAPVREETPVAVAGTGDERDPDPPIG